MPRGAKPKPGAGWTEATEASEASLTCFSPRRAGWFKFGGVEYFKINTAQALGPQAAWDNRTSIYLGASAAAEFIADIFLCPLEATRIRLVSQPDFAPSMFGAFARLLKEEGLIKGFYSGFGPICFKQIPYTMAKFAVQGKAAEMIRASFGVDPENASSGTTMAVALSSGTIAGVAAAIISHPADTLLSKVRSQRARSAGLAPRGRRRCREQGWRWWKRLDHEPPCQHCAGDGHCQALHPGPARPLRHDRQPDRRPVRHLRQRHECARSQEVPLPRPVRRWTLRSSPREEAMPRKEAQVSFWKNCTTA
eukprot:scaffold650_cov249-Pinguiococcus_pyrenoidosus.AAC.8